MNPAYTGGVEFVWSDGEPTWDSSKIYEISMMPMELDYGTSKLIVSILYKEFDKPSN